MKLAIVGSRSFGNRKLVEQFVRLLPTTMTIVSGGTKGVDRWAEDAAREAGHRVEIYLTDREYRSESADMIRNRAIVKACDAMVAFWDGQSPSTANSIKLAVDAGKPCVVARVNSDSAIILERIQDACRKKQVAWCSDLYWDVIRMW